MVGQILYRRLKELMVGYKCTMKGSFKFLNVTPSIKIEELNYERLNVEHGMK